MFKRRKGGEPHKGPYLVPASFPASDPAKEGREDTARQRDEDAICIRTELAGFDKRVISSDIN